MMTPAIYCCASSGEISPAKTTSKNNTPKAAIENGLTSQLTTNVITSPFGRSPIWRKAPKSTPTIIGKTMAQIRIATGKLTEANSIPAKR